MDNVIKQGVLRKEPNLEKNKRLSGILSKFESPKWCVLVIRDGTPYFEIYPREEDMFTGLTSSVVDLTRCTQVTYTLSKATRIFSFCIVMGDDVMQLVAASKQQMLSWVKTLETCLANLGIIESRDDSHDYTFCPAVVNRGKAADDEPEGAVGGQEVDDKEDNPYNMVDEMVNVLDAEGENIFGTIHEVSVNDLYRKASIGDLDSQAILGKLFHFDWMKEPESLPTIETQVTSPLSPANDDETGSENFVDKDFWEKNRISKVMGGASSRNGTDDSDSDLDDGYCGLKEWAHLKAASGKNSTNQNNQNFVPSSLRVSASSANRRDMSDNNTSQTPDGARGGNHGQSDDTLPKVQEENHDGSQDRNRTENIYDPFPERPNKDQSNGSVVAGAEPLGRPVPKPRKASLPLSNSLSSNPALEGSTQSTSEGNNSSTKITERLRHSQPLEEFFNLPFKVDDQSKPTDKSLNHSPKPTDERGREKTTTDIGASTIATKPLNGESNSSRRPDDSDEDSDEEYTYEGIFDKKIYPSLPVNLAPPSLPKRSDSLLPQVTPPTKPTPVNQIGAGPPIPVRANHNDGPPSLPPRNNPKGPPPLPARSQSMCSDVPPQIPNRNVAGLERQLSSRMRVDLTNSTQTMISLKHHQAELLGEETRMASISHKVESIHFPGLALVDVCDQVWIAGWNVKAFPRLHNKFHIGDQVLHINNVKVTSASVAMKTVRQSGMPMVEITIRRLPKAKVVVIRRSAEGESLGMKREKGSAEIVYVDPQGLAGKNNLHQKPPTMSGVGTCNWFITEINNRPLNLTFKDMEVEHRLGAVGKDISFVVQPTDFIMELKKQLKKITGYKNFLLN